MERTGLFVYAGSGCVDRARVFINPQLRICLGRREEREWEERRGDRERDIDVCERVGGGKH